MVDPTRTESIRQQLGLALDVVLGPYCPGVPKRDGVHDPQPASALDEFRPLELQPPTHAVQFRERDDRTPPLGCYGECRTDLDEVREPRDRKSASERHLMAGLTRCHVGRLCESEARRLTGGDELDRRAVHELQVVVGDDEPGIGGGAFEDAVEERELRSGAPPDCAVGQ
jgi:hypothetical protein